MTKLIMNLVKIIVSILIGLFATSCEIKIDGIDSIQGNGKIVTENRTVNEPFTKIEASRGLDIEVIQSEVLSISVEADDNLLEHIETKINNGILKISSDKNIRRSKSKKIKVTVTNLEKISVSSAAEVEIKNTLITPSISFKASSGGEIEAIVEAEKITCNSSSGGEISLHGKALFIDVSVSSGGEINAEELLSNQVIASASSGGSIKTHPIISLDGKVSSGGSISYYNEPNSITKQINSGGSIRFR